MAAVMPMDGMPMDMGMMEEVPPNLQAEQDQAANDADLLAAINARESTGYGTEADPAAVDRATAIDYYLGKPFGNEIEGRSQVVSRDVSDTVEWIKPSLMRIFAGGDQLCKFDPIGEEDVAAAAQESDYVDFIIQRKNPWFNISYEWFTDALLTRNAYAMAYWEEKNDTVLERYKGLTDDQLALIAQDQSVQIVSHSSYTAPGVPPSQISMAVAQMTGQMPVPMLHDCELRRVKKYGCAKISVLPPERCIVASDAKSVSVRDSDFFEFWEYKTISSLRVDGFDVPDDIADSGGQDLTLIDSARDASNQAQTSRDTDHVDPSMRKVKVRMVWIRHDYNRDGIAEYRYCVVVGSDFLVNQECSSIPVACIVPTPLPHRHIGLSIYDAINDLQLIKSAMLRQVVDNTYLANNGRTAVDKNVVNLDDMLVSRPGGVVRVNGSPQAALMPFVHPQTAAQGINVIQYLDGIRQYRTGTQQPFVGPDQIDAKALPGTVDQLTAAASQRVELIARVMAEGVKELVQIVHEVTLTNATVQDKVELRGKWVVVDPRQWKKRSDMTLSIGLGVSNQRRHIASLQMLIEFAKQALPYGLTDLNKIYNMLAELTKAMGFPGADRFFTAPPEGAMPKPQQDPRIQVAEINARADLLVQELKNHTEATVTQLKEEAAAARTFFEEQQENARVKYEAAIRAYSEATDRMHEARIAQAKQPSETKVKIAGLDGLSEAVKQTTGAASEAAKHAKSAADAVAQVKDHIAKLPKGGKRTIKSSTGKTYTVEDS